MERPDIGEDDISAERLTEANTVEHSDIGEDDISAERLTEANTVDHPDIGQDDISAERLTEANTVELHITISGESQIVKDMDFYEFLCELSQRGLPSNDIEFIHLRNEIMSQ